MPNFGLLLYLASFLLGGLAVLAYQEYSGHK